MPILEQLYESHFRTPPTAIKALQGDLGGSGRRILRLTGTGGPAIGVLYDVAEENIAFLSFSRHFRKLGLPVPEIYGEDLKQGAYLEEDLGDTTLYDYLSTRRTGDEVGREVVDVYNRVVQELPRFQVDGGRDLNYKVCYPRASFDKQSIYWDLNYFKYYFLRLAGIGFNEQGLEDDFGRLTRLLLNADRDYFLYRDFQSRNIMLRPDDSGVLQPWFVDYQGGRRGALQYDIASLLYDGKADLPPLLRQNLLDRYLDALSGHIDLDRAGFLHYYYAYVYVRIFQALGAYGFRGFYERKQHFLQSVPYALSNLRWLERNVELPVALPTLMEAVRGMLGSEKLQKLGAAKKVLTVRVMSFSFHRGMPADDSGNGGGYVFDARCIPNPGREEAFRRLTGKDAPVIHYLQQQESAHRFLASARALADMSVENYKERGFEHLMISFGCTGGQHRSVYLAEQMAQHLRAQRGVHVLVEHREREHWPR